MPFNILITDHNENNLRKTSDMVATISNTQLADLKPKPHEGPSIIDLINCKIGTQLYPQP